MGPQAEDDERGGYQVARVLALSDGVFAIALTLLAFSMRVAPDARADRLGDIVRNQWPVFFAYALSVVVIGGLWIGHHRVFARISVVDTGLLWINFVFLGLLAVVPYSTDLLAGSRPRAPRWPSTPRWWRPSRSPAGSSTSTPGATACSTLRRESPPGASSVPAPSACASCSR